MDKRIPKISKGFAAKLKSLYKMTPEEYIARLSGQDFRCKICGMPPDAGKKLHVDHNHGTGKVRGILCRRCNHVLGLVRG